MLCRHVRGHAMNAQSSRSHAIITVHFDSWASTGSKEDEDAEQGERLFGLIEKARRLQAHPQATHPGMCNYVFSLSTQDIARALV